MNPPTKPCSGTARARGPRAPRELGGLAARIGEGSTEQGGGRVAWGGREQRFTAGEASSRTGRTGKSAGGSSRRLLAEVAEDEAERGVAANIVGSEVVVEPASNASVASRTADAYGGGRARRRRGRRGRRAGRSRGRRARRKRRRRSTAGARGEGPAQATGARGVTVGGGRLQGLPPGFGRPKRRPGRNAARGSAAASRDLTSRASPRMQGAWRTSRARGCGARGEGVVRAPSDLRETEETREQITENVHACVETRHDVRPVVHYPTTCAQHP